MGSDVRCWEVQKLAWFIVRGAEETGTKNPLELKFARNIYGPYSDRLRHLLDRMDGSYLGCEVRLADAGPSSEIWFNQDKKAFVNAYLHSEGKRYLPSLEWAATTIRGFESPLGMELLATVDWLLQRQGVAPNVRALREGLKSWGNGSARKLRIFDDRLLNLALGHMPGNPPRSATVTQPSTSLADR